VDYIKIDLGETAYDDVDWMHYAQNRDLVEGSCEHGNESSVPYNFGKFSRK
jgi:hypothetical protein